MFLKTILIKYKYNYIYNIFKYKMDHISISFLYIIIIVMIVVPVVVLIISFAKTSQPPSTVCIEYNFFFLKVVRVGQDNFIYISEYDQNSKLISNTEIIGLSVQKLRIATRGTSAIYSPSMLVFNTSNGIVLYNTLSKQYYIIVMSNTFESIDIIVQNKRIICSGSLNDNSPVIVAFLFTGNELVVDPTFNNQSIPSFDSMQFSGIGKMRDNKLVVVSSYTAQNGMTIYKLGVDGQILIEKPIIQQVGIENSSFTPVIVNEDDTIYVFSSLVDTITGESNLRILHYSSDLEILNTFYTTSKANTIWRVCVDTDGSFFTTEADVIVSTKLEKTSKGYLYHYSSDFQIIDFVELPYTSGKITLLSSIEIINDSVIVSGGMDAEFDPFDEFTSGALFSFNKYTLKPDDTLVVPQLIDSVYSGITSQCIKRVNVLT